MERFFDNTGEPFFDSDDEEEIISNMDQEAFLDMMRINLSLKELNQELLDRAITLNKNSWGWCFKSLRRKLTEISTTYEIFKELTSLGNDGELDADV